MSLAFDHVAIAARTLDEGAAWLAGHGLTQAFGHHLNLVPTNGRTQGV